VNSEALTEDEKLYPTVVDAGITEVAAVPPANGPPTVIVDGLIGVPTLFWMRFPFIAVPITLQVRSNLAGVALLKEVASTSKSPLESERSIAPAI
jgi:hypothetical protein